MATQNIDKNPEAQGRLPDVAGSASYRLLFNGDLLAEGCESLQDDAETWIPTEPAFWGTRYNCEFFRPMRMPNVERSQKQGAQDSATPPTSTP